MKHNLIHLSRVAALLLAAICAPCLQAREREPREFEVEYPLASRIDETRGIKCNELASYIPSGIPDQTTKYKEPPIPQVPPLQIYSGGWGFTGYITYGFSEV
jgi:hypothetical protein